MHLSLRATNAMNSQQRQNIQTDHTVKAKRVQNDAVVHAIARTTSTEHTIPVENSERPGSQEANHVGSVNDRRRKVAKAGASMRMERARVNENFATKSSGKHACFKENSGGPGTSEANLANRVQNNEGKGAKANVTQTRNCVTQRRKGEVEVGRDKIIRHWVRKLVHHLQGGEEDYEISEFWALKNITRYDRKNKVVWFAAGHVVPPWEEEVGTSSMFQHVPVCVLATLYLRSQEGWVLSVLIVSEKDGLHLELLENITRRESAK